MRRDAVDRLLDQAVEAIVVAVAHRDALDLVAPLDLPVPVVLVQGVRTGRAHGRRDRPASGALLATGHLLDLGHRGTSPMSAGPPDWVEAAQRRRRLARRPTSAAAPRPARRSRGTGRPRSGYEAGLRLAADADVTAVFVANDAMALGVLQALHE